MDTLEFLRLVWPEEGLFLLSTPQTFHKDGETVTYHKHHCFRDMDTAAQAATQFAQTQDVYFALGTVHADYTRMNKAQRDNLGVKVRGGSNTREVKAFWLDIDVGQGDDKYPDQGTAAHELRQFCNTVGMPPPYIVTSGGGLHVYWPLTESIDAATWQAHADIFKSMVKLYKFRADPSRTADPASVLRPVGTFNHKTGTPRPVQAVVTGVVTPTMEFLTFLQDCKDRYTLHIPEAYVTPADMLGPAPAYLQSNLIPVQQVNEDAAAGAGQARPKSRTVVERCPQLMWQLCNPASVPEPLWYSMIGVMRFTENGETAIHKLSAGHPGYSQSRVDDKINQHENSGAGPTLCSTFASHMPDICAGCPYNGHIKTPLQAAKDTKTESAPPPEVVTETPEGTVTITLPPPPPPYKRVAHVNGDSCYIVVNKALKAGGDEDEVVYEYDIYPYQLVMDERAAALCVAIKMWLPHEGWSERLIPAADFYDRRALSRHLGAAGVMVDVAKMEELTQYMVAYIRELQKHAQANVVYAQLGWRDDRGSFVLPDRVVDHRGTTRIDPSTNITNALGWVEPKGDLEVWKQCVAIFNRPGMEGHLFAFGVGFAAPLFRFTNFTGAMVSVVGKRGTGKTSAALAANTVWGHKKLGWVDMGHDTWKAFYGKMGALNNLPVTYDEITNLPPETISDLAYAVTKGQGRQRLQQSGQAAENFGNWNTIMLATSNASLHNRLAAAKTDASAEASRIFEYTVPPSTLTKGEADANFDLLNDHYGLAAEPFVAQLLKDRERARESVQNWIKRIDAAASVDSSERFWSAVPAAVLAGFEVANSAGLTTANVETLFHFAVKAINGMRGAVTDIVRTSESMVSEYINSNMRSMLVLESEPAGKTLARISIAPQSERLRIRLERYSGMLYLDRPDFRRFCQDKGADPREVEMELTASGILLSNNRRMVLGKGTIYSTTQTHCWMLDFNNPALSGSVQAVSTSAPPQEIGIAQQ